MEKECRTDLVTYLKKLKLQSEFSEPSDRVSCDQLDGGPIKDYDHWMKRNCATAGVPYFGFKGIRHLVAVGTVPGRPSSDRDQAQVAP